MALAEKIGRSLAKHAEKEGKKASAKTGDKKDIHHFEVHPAKGGHLVQVHVNRTHSDGYKSQEHDKTLDSIHKTMSSAHKHMSSMCNCGNCGEADSGVVVGKEKVIKSDED